MLESLRPLFAWALLGYAALEIFFVLVRWAEPSDRNFSSAAADADFTTLITIGFPILAVVLVRTRIMATVALMELASVLGLGGLAYVIGLYSVVWHPSGVAGVLSYVFLGVAGLGFAALCGFACLRVVNPPGSHQAEPHPR